MNNADSACQFFHGPMSLIHDWNQPPATRPAVMLDDETLRDGLQSPSVRCPTIDEKIRILHLIDRLGIDTANIGLPGAGPQVVNHRVVHCHLLLTIEPFPALGACWHVNLFCGGGGWSW